MTRQTPRKYFYSLAVLSLAGFLFLNHLWSAVRNMTSFSTAQVEVKLNPAEKRIAIDQKYCGGPCRFLLPVFIFEQESKAQMHVRQLAFMAGSINRTFVLPNIDDSQIGACRKYDFSMFYSTEWVESKKDHFTAISLPKFQSWLEERHAIGIPATSQNLIVHLNRTVDNDAPNCFEHLMDMGNLPDRRLYLEDTFRRRRTGIYERIMREFLTGQPLEEPADEDHIEYNDELAETTQNLEVISLHYDRRMPFTFNDAVEEPIPFSPQLMNTAEQLASSLTPYWAIHWRMETVYPPENLVGCAKSLVTLVKDLAHKVGLEVPPTLFLLTDYPHVFDENVVRAKIQGLNVDESKLLHPASGSFAPENLTVHHHQAMRYLYENLAVRVTDFHDDNTNVPANWTVLPVKGPIEGDDAGMLGVIDKLLAIRAPVFIAGEPRICGRKSSFTERIIHDRIERKIEMSGDSNVDDKWQNWSTMDPNDLNNIVQFFTLPS